MNRIQHLIEEELGTSMISSATMTERADEAPSSEESSHCIFTPMHYERNYAYPLIVWLHGDAGDEQQVNRVMPLVSMRNYVAVGPRATLSLGGAEAGYRWSQNPRHIMLSEQRVMSAIAAAQRWLNIAPNRIYLAGFGGGGTMAFRLALGQPHLFAGVLSIGGAFPTTMRPLGQLNAARRLPIFLASARDSERYPPEKVCDHLRLFHSAGMSINLRQYPCGDDLTTQMLSDMDRWIMEQITAPAPAEADRAGHRSSGK